MSYARLVRASLTAGNPTALRSVRASWVPEAEIPLYDFVTQYMARHRVMPTEDAIVAARIGVVLPAARRVEEPPSYYLERLRESVAFMHVSGLQAEYVTAMESRNMRQVQQVLRRMLAGMGTVANADAYVSLGATVAEVREDYLLAKENPGALRGHTLGWPTLDAMTLGMQAGDIWVFSGRPGMGKSWMLVQIAHRLWQQGVSVLLVTMEMGRVQLVRRFIGKHAAVNPNFIRAGQLSTWGEEQLMRAMNQIEGDGERFWIVQGDFSKDIQGVTEIADELDPQVILIDAAYLLTDEGRAKGYVSKWENIAGVMGSLKKYLVSRDKSSVISVQFNRNISSSMTSDREQEPDSSDIAGGDSISQDASGLVGVLPGRSPHQEDQRQLVLFKNREGELGRFSVHYQFSPVNLDEVLDLHEGFAAAQDWAA